MEHFTKKVDVLLHLRYLEGSRQKCYPQSSKKLGVFTITKSLFKDALLGSDDLTIFQCFRVIFSLKKKTIQFPLLFNLYFQQKKPQSCQFATYRRNALFEFLTSQTGEMAFPIFKVSMRQLCISLSHQPNAIHYFENTLKPLTEIILMS